MAKSTLEAVPVSQGEIIDLEIKSMAHDNSAIACYQDFIIFVERGAPGDKVKAQIITIRPNYARAKIIEIMQSDPNYRIKAPCKLFKVCGGCQWQHLPYEKQLEQKDFLMKQFCTKLNLEQDVLKRVIGANIRTEGSGLPASCGQSLIWNYRNKVQYPVRTVESTARLKAGYFEWRSNELVNIKHCPVQHELFDGVIETVRELAPKYKIVAYDSKTKKGWLRHICLRTGFKTGETLLTLVAKDEKLPRSQEFVNEIMKKHPELVGICININTASTNVIYGPNTKALKGKGYIFEEVQGTKYKVSATGFFQINTMQAERLLEIVKEYLNPTIQDTILDAYSGVGLISLFLAKFAKKVIGIEEVKQSIEDATFSAKENNVKNASFILGKVENKINETLEKEKPNILVLDPPRAGCTKKVLESILKSKVEKIIYVSCNPATLARDLAILKEGKFQIKSIQPIDMFPHTYHIECIALLEWCN